MSAPVQHLSPTGVRSHATSEAALAATRRLRILAVTPHFLPQIGGTELHTYETARRLAAAGHHVAVLTTRDDSDVPARDVIDGIPVYRAASFGNRLDLRLAPAIGRVIRAGAWDLVHVQGIHTLVAPLAMLAARRAGIPYVVTFHSGGHSSRLRNAVRSTQWRLVRPLAARANALIGVSDFEAGYFREQLGLRADQVVTIPNGAHLPAPTGRPAPPGEGPLIVSVGRLERYKGHHRVVAAFPHVLRRHPTARLRIAGSGPYEEELRGQARGLGIHAAVTIGAIPAGERERMTDLLQQAAVVTLLSEYESHGIAALEAISLGRPTIVTNATALGELVERRLAVGLAPASTPEEIADAICGQIERPHQPPPVELPSWDECAARLGELYASIVTDTPCVS